MPKLQVLSLRQTEPVNPAVPALTPLRSRAVPPQSTKGRSREALPPGDRRRAARR